MIDELENLSLEVWPQTLIDFLKKYKNTNLDLVFQSDIIWLDDSSELRSFENGIQNNYLEIGKQNSSEHPYIQTKNEFNIDSLDEIEKQNEKKHSYDFNDNSLEMDVAIKTLLDSSVLLEENIYNLTDKETWMDKSFDIRVSFDTQTLTSQFDKIPTKLRKSQNINKNNRFPAQNSNKTTQRIYQEYNNNTILNQFAVNNISENKFGSESFDLYQSILKYKSITNLIENHLKNESNIFYQLIKLFESYFINAYAKCLEIPDQENLILNEANDHAIKATLDLQQFIRILYEALSLFYNLKSLRSGKLPDNESLFNRDNMINFITSIVINDQIYNLIFKLCQKQDNQLEESYRKNLKLCKSLKPEDFGVPEAYCLNENTFHYFKEKNLLGQTCFMKELMEATNEATSEKMEAMSNTLTDKTSESGVANKSEELHLYLEEQRMNKDIFNNPYAKAIETLSTLQERRSPIHKLKTILKVIELISVAIEEFYKQFGVINSKKLDADQTLSICLYVVARSGLHNITTHCKLIERFSTTNVLHSVSGYYATTLEACVNCLCAMELPQNASADEISVSIKKHKQSLDMTS